MIDTGLVSNYMVLEMKQMDDGFDIGLISNYMGLEMK